jgi:hypothetical protein
VRLGGPKEVINSFLPASSLLYFSLSSTDRFPLKTSATDDYRKYERMSLSCGLGRIYLRGRPTRSVLPFGGQTAALTTTRNLGPVWQQQSIERLFSRLFE